MTTNSNEFQQLSRRSLLRYAPLLALLGAHDARAHHGWSSFDLDKPIYIEGAVRSARWQNPHVELEIDVTPGFKLPADLARRQTPAQTQSVDGAAILAKARLPANAAKSWAVELAPLTRLEAWKIKQPAIGAAIAAIGYALPGEKSTTMRVEYLILDGQIYGLRSSPV
jgi:Family of unknown function (DUF6152)